MKGLGVLSLLPLLATASPRFGVDTIHNDAAPLLSSSESQIILDSYIIVFKKDVSHTSASVHHSWVQDQHVEIENTKRDLHKRSQIPISFFDGLKHTFDIAGALLGYTGHFDNDLIEKIRLHPDVAYIEKDSEVHTMGSELETNAPWGLARISHRDSLTLGTFSKYLYSTEGGEGVDVYVIDTGTHIDHVDFEGRASWGKTIPPNDEDLDGNGHGTHCSGTIAGKKYGVAKKANIFAVKVLKSNGVGSMSDVVKGVEWAANRHIEQVKAVKSGKGKKGFKGSAANMSLGGGKSITLELTVNAAVDAGIHFAVAAGNDNANSCKYSPASAEKAVTVGASTLADERAYFSNYGKCNDIFAPGYNIESTWIGSKYATNTISGTSMASPHIAGLLAYFLSLQPSKDSAYAMADITPEKLKKTIIKIGTQDSLTDVPSDTDNILAWNGGGASNFTDILRQGSYNKNRSGKVEDLDLSDNESKLIYVSELNPQPNSDTLTETNMPTPGYVFKDGGPIPDSELNDPQDATRSSTSNSSTFNTPTSIASLASAPTDSHALANAEHEERGAAQQNHDGGEVKNLGWFEKPDEIASLVGGLPNAELWTLIRRFNKQMYHVKATSEHLLGGLDLNIADEEEFSPDKLRSNVERLYMTVIIGLMGMGNHIARLRSWREPRRTASFFTVYTLAWIFNFLIPTFFLTLIVLIAYPPSRHILFPPAPLALVNSKTGGVQSPKAGVLGSHDSATGAPEKHQGEAVEQEAHNFVSGIGSIALSSAAGKHEQADPESDPLDKSVPDPTRLATAGAEAKTSAAGGTPGVHHDKTKQPMEDAMWTKMRPIMHVVGDVADGWERFANALSPTAPFPKEAPRLRLAGIILPVFAVSILITSEMVVKGTTFFVGVGFFGDPLIWRAFDLLNKKIPNWQKYLEIRNTVLKGIPTNAQLTITLLRIGEANKAPLPPPPISDQPPSSRPKSLNGDDLDIDASNDEIHAAIHQDPAEKVALEDAEAEKPKHRHGEHIIGFFKGTTKTGVEAKLGIDKVKAKVGSSHARNHLGILPKASEQILSGPVDFKARYHGHKGWVYISTTATESSVCFSRKSSEGTGDVEKTDVAFSIPIKDIRELKKIGGLGWKAKLVVGWATGKTVADGLEITDRTGNVWKLTAIRLREELFNRLVAMGEQKWESW